MRIAVIADTHNRLPASLRPALAAADEIWHLGDICNRAVLDEIRGLGPAVTAIRGNCDPANIAPETLLLDRCGRTFFLSHEPCPTPPQGAAFALHGHTHVPKDETVRGIRHLNPGTVSKPNHGAPASFAWLDLAEDRDPLWTIVPVE